VSRGTTCAGATLAMPPFLSPADDACMLVSLDVTYTVRALSLRDTVAGSVENSCRKQRQETTIVRQPRSKLSLHSSTSTQCFFADYKPLTTEMNNSSDGKLLQPLSIFREQIVPMATNAKTVTLKKPHSSDFRKAMFTI